MKTHIKSYLRTRVLDLVICYGEADFNRAVINTGDNLFGEFGCNHVATIQSNIGREKESLETEEGTDFVLDNCLIERIRLLSLIEKNLGHTLQIITPVDR